VNIFGLAIGLMFSIIIFLYAHKELSYDRFHRNADRIYRVAVDGLIAGNRINIPQTATPLAETMKKEIPDVEDAVRVARFGAWLLRNDSIRYNEDNLIFSDPGFFKMFSFPLIKGTPDEVLKNPFSIVLSESSAHKYFGSEDPVGRKLRVENDSTYYTVTGVMKDVPENSSLQFDMVGAISTYYKMLANDRWIIHYLFTYFTLKEGGSINHVKDGLSDIAQKHVIPDYQRLLNLTRQQSFENGNYYHFITEPLTDIHLKSASETQPTGKILYVYLFIALAVIIMVLSCLNFINLVTAQSMKRSLEVGIRKISGSERPALIAQFLLESSLLAFFALALALLFTELLLPAFSAYIGVQLNLNQLLNSAGFAMLIVLIVFIGVISGLYPAWYLSACDPGTVIHNRSYVFHDKGRFRKALSVFQLFLAIGALSMTMIVFYQYNYLVNKDRGYDTSNLLMIRRPDALTGKLEKFKKQIKSYNGVISVSNATNPMGSGFPRFPYYPDGGSAARSYSSSTLLVSYDFDSTYRLKLISGRFFNRNSDDTMACVINETAMKLMDIRDPVGKTLYQLSDVPEKTTKRKIIGVVNDFNYETLENPIRPLVMLFLPGNYEGYLSVRIKPEDQQSTVQYIKRTWESYTDAYPFVYYFLDQDRRDYYKPVLTTGRIFVLLSVVNILMACLSLFSLIWFTYNKKQRETGILKVVGASSKSILMLRTAELIRLILAASVIAWTGSYFLARYWLNNYANHIGIQAAYFLVPSIIVSLISIAAVYYHTLMASNANPGSALKYE
jgi:putative ABC transport system permease protein